MTHIQTIALAVLVLTAILDPLRDAFQSDPVWLKRKMFKWPAYYLPSGFIAIYFLKWLTIPTALFCWVVWRLTLKYIAKKQWDSWIQRVIKEGVSWMVNSKK